MSKKLLDHAALFMFVLMVCVVLSCMGLAEDQGSMLLQTGSLIRSEEPSRMEIWITVRKRYSGRSCPQKMMFY